MHPKEVTCKDESDKVHKDVLCSIIYYRENSKFFNSKIWLGKLPCILE